MKVQLESTTKIVEVNGVPARVWEGITESGIQVHCFITRIAINEKESEEAQAQFKNELQECRTPSAGIEAYPLRMIL